MAVESGSAKAREWQRRFDRYHASETTVQTFCAGERVMIAAFYYWRKTLGRIGRVSTNDLAACDPNWASLLSPREQTRLVQLLVERVNYDGHRKKVAVMFRPDGIRAFAENFGENAA